MSGQPDSPSGSGAADIFAAEEDLLRALFSALPDAMADPEFGVSFAHYLRRRMQRLHPPGQADIRQVRSRDGQVFSIDLGDRFAAEIYYGRFAEPFELALMAALCEPQSVFVDVGAHFGLYAVTCGRNIDPERGGCVLAVEPAPPVLPLLERNVGHNGLADRVEVIRACAGPSDGETLFHVATESSLSGISATGRSPVAEVATVQLRALASLLRERGRDRLDLLKVDAEGHEHGVLLGALPLLESHRCIVMIETSAKNLDASRRAALRDVLRRLVDAGYALRWLDPAERMLRTAEAPEPIVAMTGTSVFLARRDSESERRLLAAAAEVRMMDDTFPSFVPLPAEGRPAPGAMAVSGHLRDLPVTLAIHLQRERERNAELAELFAEREWLARGMERIAAGQERILEQVGSGRGGRGANSRSAWHRILGMAGRLLPSGRS